MRENYGYLDAFKVVKALGQHASDWASHLRQGQSAHNQPGWPQELSAGMSVRNRCADKNTSKICATSAGPTAKK